MLTPVEPQFSNVYLRLSYGNGCIRGNRHGYGRPRGMSSVLDRVELPEEEDFSIPDEFFQSTPGEVIDIVESEEEVEAEAGGRLRKGLKRIQMR